jgi:hypothetical protein
MLKRPFASWIADAAVGLTGLYGDGTRRAEVAGCSRRTIYDHAHKVQAAVVDAPDGGPTRAELIGRDQRLGQENAQLRDRLAQTIDFPPSQQRESSVTAAAMGLSLDQVLAPLALILGQRAGPGRSTPHRRIKLAGVAAGRALKLLDARCRALVPVGRPDEIFSHGRPVPVGVEPASMTWSLGHEAADRTGATWAEASRHWDSLSFVAAGAGQGPQAGIAAVRREREEEGKPSLEGGLDVSHTTYEARRVLRRIRDRVERSWERAEAASRRVVESRRRGRDARGPARVASLARERAESAFAEYERSEAGWEMAHGALAIFRPDGQLNDRARASQQVALALPLLSGPERAKVRRSLQAEGALMSLDRLHRQLGGAVVEDSLACGAGAVVVAASATAASECHRFGRGCGPWGASGARGGVPGDRPQLARVVRRGVRRVRRDGAGQRRGGMHERRASDAPVAAPDGKTRAAGPEASVLG